MKLPWLNTYKKHLHKQAPVRACEDFITAGHVGVNGKFAEIVQKADSAINKITVDGKVVSATESMIYVALYKTRKTLSTVEGEPGDDRKNVRDRSNCLVNEPPHASTLWA